MKFSTFAVWASAIFSTAAQDRADFLPKCALQCLDDATKRVTDCDLDSAVCWCIQSNYEAIYDAGVTCVLDSCGPDKALLEVLPGARRFCDAATASAKAATATPTSMATGSASTENSTAHITTAASSPGATVKSTTTSPGAAASSGSIASAALLFAGVLAVL